MKPDQADRACQPFDQALDLADPVERPAFLQRECAPMNDSIFSHRVVGPAFAAMAHEKLGNREEALRLLKLADHRFHDLVIVPGERMHQPDFTADIMMEMVIKEADREIDPDVDNAPHVAALPTEGW